jgi:hypothetical protein
MVCTPDLVSHQVRFLRTSRDSIHLLHRRWPTLQNMVDERNERHMIWLSWMGFAFTRRIASYGAEGRPFLFFHRTQHV